MNRTATNPETGERIAFVGDAWVPITKTASNPATGEQLGLAGDAWIPLAVAAPAAPPPLEGSEIGRGFRTGWENVKNSPDRSALLTSASQAEANKRLLGLYDKVDAGKKPEEANSWLYDALASGAPSTATGDMLRPSDKDLEDRLFARLQAAYAEASPAERKALRAATDKDYKKAIAGVGEGVEAVAKAQTKNAPNRGTVENRSDIKNASDAWKWLEYNVGAGAAQYGPVAAAAFLSPNKLAPVTALGTSSYMALGAGVEQRLAAIGEAVKDLPKDEQTKVISKYLDTTKDATIAQALAEGALDAVAGPTGRVVFRQLGKAAIKEAGKELPKQTIKQIAKEEIKDIPKQMGEEFVTGGLQEVTNIAAQRALGEQTGDVLTKENLLRVLDSAAAEAAGAIGGAGINTGVRSGAAAVRNYRDKVKTKEAERQLREVGIDVSAEDLGRRLAVYAEEFRTQGADDKQAMKLAGERIMTEVQGNAGANGQSVPGGTQSSVPSSDGAVGPGAVAPQATGAGNLSVEAPSPDADGAAQREGTVPPALAPDAQGTQDVQNLNIGMLADKKVPKKDRVQLAVNLLNDAILSNPAIDVNLISSTDFSKAKLQLANGKFNGDPVAALEAVTGQKFAPEVPVEVPAEVEGPALEEAAVVPPVVAEEVVPDIDRFAEAPVQPDVEQPPTAIEEELVARDEGVAADILPDPATVEGPTVDQVLDEEGVLDAPAPENTYGLSLDVYNRLLDQIINAQSAEQVGEAMEIAQEAMELPVAQDLVPLIKARREVRFPKKDTVATPAEEEYAGGDGSDSGVIEQGKQKFAEGVVNDFMVGDRVRMGSTMGTVVGLDGGNVRFRSDQMKNPKGYAKVPKKNLKLVSRPDTASTSSASKTKEQENKFGTEQGRLNADMAGLIQLLGANMYAANLGEVTVKELLQNAFDAVKGAISGKKAPSLYKMGKIEVIVNAEDRTITVKDNARGMTADIVRDAFFTIAGSDKSDLEPSQRSGGLGLAKMGFMLGAEQLTLDTVRDGVRVRVDTTSTDIANNNFKIEKSQAPKGEHGTTVTAKIPTHYIDPKSGDKQDIWFPYGLRDLSSLNRPLIGPVEVEFTYQDSYGSAPTTETLPIGANFPYDDYQKLKVNFDWGSADIYYGKERKEYANHRVLSSGVYQFDTAFKVDQNSKIPYDIIVDVKPNVDAKHPDYPFENSRERFKGRLKEDISAMGGYLRQIALGEEASNMQDALSNVVSLPRIEAGEEIDSRQLGKDLNAAFDTKKKKAAPKKIEAVPDTVTVKDGTAKDGRGRTLFDNEKDREKNRRGSFEAEKAAPTTDDFKIDLGHDPRKPIFHNNTNIDFIAEGDKVGNPAMFFAELGSILVEMKEILAASGLYRYEGLSAENLFFAGIAIDKKYGGLHTKIPYKALFLNPFYNWGAQSLFGVRSNMMIAMMHEIAHMADMSHGVGHNEQMVKVEQYLADEGMYDYFKDALLDVLVRHEAVFDAMGKLYGRSDTKNIAKSLEDYGTDSAAASAGGNSGGSSNQPAAVPTGGGRGGGSNIPPTGGGGTGSPKRRGPRKSGKTPASVKKLEDKLARSHDAEENNVTVSQLVADTRSPEQGRSLLQAAWDAGNVKRLRLVLNLYTNRGLVQGVTKYSRALANKLKGALDGMEKMAASRATAMMETMDKVKPWERFNIKYKEGGKLLADLLHAATLVNVDPRSASSLAALIAADPKLAAIQKKYPGKRVGSMTSREAEIKKVWDMWEALSLPKNGSGKGRELFDMAVTNYKDNFDHHYKLLVDNINKAGLSQQRTTQALADVKKMFDEARKVGLYVPLMRYGNFWLSLGKGAKREYYMFDSEVARNKYLNDRAAAEGKTVADMRANGEIDSGNNLNGEGGISNQLMRDEPSTLLKKVYDSLGATSAATTADLKDMVFQMYLMAMPEGAVARRFTHRRNVTGFSSDALRNFVASNVSSANQFARMEHGAEVRNSIGSAYALLAGDPDKEKLLPFVDQMAERMGEELKPEQDESLINKIVTMGNKFAFLQFMTSVKSAAVQFTQLPIVGMPILMARYGAAAPLAVSARYMGNFLNKFGVFKYDAQGNMTSDWGELSIGKSRYVNRNKNGALRDTLVYGFKDAQQRGIFSNTYTADLTDRSRVSTRQFNSKFAKGSRAAINFISGGLHHSERLSREIMYMSALELEYNALRKKGVPHDAAKLAAAEAAADLTLEAMFDFSQSNKPPLYKGWAGRLVFQLMAFPLHMTSYLAHNFFQMIRIMPTKQERAAAAIKFFGTVGMTWMFAGAVGMPGYSMIMGLLSGIRDMLRPAFDDEDEDPYYDEDEDGNPLGKRNLDLWFREWFLPHMFGSDSELAKSLGLDKEDADDLQRLVEMGPVSTASDLNIGASTSLNNMWFRDETTADDTPTAILQMATNFGMGASGKALYQFGKGIDQWAEGDAQRGLEKMIPAFFKGTLMGQRLKEEGMKTPDGKILKGNIDNTFGPEFYTTGRLLAQDLGFASTTVAEIQQKNNLANKIIKEIEKDRAAVLKKVDRAYRRWDDDPSNKNEEGMDEALRKVEEYNYKNQVYPITGEQLRSSLEERAKDRAMSETFGGIVPPKPFEGVAYEWAN